MGTHEVDVTIWNKATQSYMPYTVTCQEGGLICKAPFGYSQYVGVNLLDIIKDYQLNNVAYYWSLITPLIRRGFSTADANAIATGLKDESECQTTPKPK